MDLNGNNIRPNETENDWAYRAAVGGISGFAFYIVVPILLLREALGGLLSDGGPTPWVCRVMADPINAATLVVFGAAVSLLLGRGKKVAAEEAILVGPLAGQDPETLLLKEDAREFRMKISEVEESIRRRWLYRLMKAGLDRARAAWSPTDVASAIDAQGAILSAELDTQYSLVRYLAWAIPSIGFIGTVLGIGNAMGSASRMGNSGSTRGIADSAIDSVGNIGLDHVATGATAISEAAGHLNMAFDTTFVALALSLILMLQLHLVQAREESLLTALIEYSHRLLPNRMHIAGGGDDA